MATAYPSTARDIVAGVIAARGPAYANLANNVRTGGTPNQFIQVAVEAAEEALRRPRDDDE
jgi:hypothetical protein